MKDMRTPLNKIRGLGTAKSGTRHFWLQRLTAVANIPLFIWFIFLLISFTGQSDQEIKAIIASPCVAILLSLMLISGLYHMKLGLQVVIEDYIHGHLLKIILLILNNFFSLTLGIICLFSIIKLSLGG
ncbi:succinate dehydrogenase, hydrophobic membrane anchor protein [Bartonella sp. DGB1]|uniref:succinate dehydrogenase, hydrophobic membrane anchor protein n=1 Tax=Bartonella sp. DGB1 TaxID=3239807 RepID=UPI003523EC89